MKTWLGFFLWIYCFLSSCIVLGQQDARLSGVVVELNSQFETGKLNYLSNVEVKSPGAAPQLSTADGKFTLIFPDKNLTKVVRVYAEKNGYETVNDEELKKAAVLGRSTPLKIVLCKKGQVYKNQMVYYKIAKDAPQADYERRYAILEKEGKEKERLLEELQLEFKVKITSVTQANELLLKQLHTTQQIANDLAANWEGINLDDQSETYQNAFRAYSKNNIDEAIRLLESADLENRLATNTAEKAKEENQIKAKQKRVAQREKEIEQDINQCRLNARMYLLKFNYKKVEEQLKLALKYAPTHQEVLSDYALFLRKQNRFQESIELYQKALTVYQDLASKKQEDYRQYIAYLLNEMGGIYHQSKQIEKASEKYTAALAIYQELADETPEFHLNNLGIVNNSLGKLAQIQKQPKQAILYFEKALEIRRTLAKENQDEDLVRLFSTLNMLSFLQMQNQNLPLAKTYIDEAQVFLEEMPHQYLPLQIKNLNTLGYWYEYKGDWKNAASSFRKALELHGSIFLNDEDNHQALQADNFLQLGYSLQQTKDLDNAKYAFGEGLSILKQLDLKHNISKLTRASLHLGLIYQQQFLEGGFTPDKDSGLAVVEEALVRIDQYSSNFPDKERLQKALQKLQVFFANLTEKDETLIEINILIKENLTEQDIQEKIFRQETIVARLDILTMEYEEDLKLKTKLAEEYNNLSWFQLLGRDFKDAEYAARNGLKEDASKTILYTNLAPALLFQGKLEQAKAIYVQYKDQVLQDSRNFKAVFLEDFEALEKEGITHPDVDEIRKLLK